jgi:hypothetical protein
MTGIRIHKSGVPPGGSPSGSGQRLRWVLAAFDFVRWAVSLDLHQQVP